MLPIVVHPAVVHFPLAMLLSAWVCILAWHRTGLAAWNERAGLFELVGVASTPIVILAGFVDDAGFVFERVWDDPVIWHASAGILASVVFAGHWWWRRTLPAGRPGTQLAAIDVGWATAAMWLFVLVGFVGGEMVHA